MKGLFVVIEEKKFISEELNKPETLKESMVGFKLLEEAIIHAEQKREEILAEYKKIEPTASSWKISDKRDVLGRYWIYRACITYVCEKGGIVETELVIKAGILF